MYSYELPINALRILREGEHEDVMHYIKTFHGEGGFIYGEETDPYRIAMKEKMQQLLDDGGHSGGSWGFMLRLVQAVLKGTYTFQDLLDSKEKEDERYQLWLAQNAWAAERINRERAEVLAEKEQKMQ
jgi:hypothetical protein